MAGAYDDFLNQVFYSGPQTKVVGKAGRADHIAPERPSQEKALARLLLMRELAEREEWAAKGLPVPPDAPSEYVDTLQMPYGVRQMHMTVPQEPERWPAKRIIDD